VKMKQVTQLIWQSALHRLATLAMIVGVIGWGVGLNPGRALAEFAQNDFGDQGVFIQTSPIETPTGQPTTPPPTNTPTATPQPTNTPVATSTATSVPLPTNTPGPTATPIPDSISLTFEGPAGVVPGQTFDVSVIAQGITEPSLYGIQFEINYDPALFSVGGLQVNPDLPVVILNDADNISGKIRFAAARQGDVPGLTGNVTLLTFTATAASTAGSATFTFANYKLGDPQALALEATSQSYTISIEGAATPEPTPDSTETPAPLPTDTPTAVPSETPDPLPTDTPTPGPTETAEPLPTPSPGPTQTPDPQPTSATVVGQIILAGRANNDWSGGSATLADSQQTSTTDAGGNFSIAAVTGGVHTAITADAPGYLPAVCTAPTITAPETHLAKITLLSGDVNDDGEVNISDATAIGVSLGQTGSDLPADINRDQQVDVLDLILVAINFGQGPQTWECLVQ
jgi:hypothetical protein